MRHALGQAVVHQRREDRLEVAAARSPGRLHTCAGQIAENSATNEQILRPPSRRNERLHRSDLEQIEMGHSFPHTEIPLNSSTASFINCLRTAR